MSKSITKAFEILEWLAMSPDRPRPLGEIAHRVDMKPSSCAYLVKGLLSVGAIAQEGVRGGYRLGPTIEWLGRYRWLRQDLVAIAEPLMNAAAAALGETILLAALAHGKRHILAVAEGNQAVAIRLDYIASQDVYITSTGRLLMAYLSPREQREFLAENGAPGKTWPEAEDAARMERETAALREAGLCIVAGEGMTQVAVPVWAHGQVVAVLGMPAPTFRFRGEQRERLIQELRGLAERIGRAAELIPSAAKRSLSEAGERG